MTCPHCGSDERLGVWLARGEIVIFDKIKRAGSAGVPHAAFSMNRRCLNVNIHHINNKLKVTEWLSVASQGIEIHGGGW